MRATIALAVLVAPLLLLTVCTGSCTGSRTTGATPSDGVYVFAPDTRAAGPSPAGKAITAAALREVLEDDVALDFVVESKIYPEDRETMYLTLRGGGVSVYDVADPGRPQLIGRASPELDVEGQDRLGDLLVVIARSGRVLTFDVSERAIRRLGVLELDTRPGLGARVRGSFVDRFGTGPFDALHTKIYRPGPPGRTFCMVTAPHSRELIAVDISDPARPVQVGAVDTKIEFVEGIYLKDDHAFVGGFGDSKAFTAVDISDPSAMRIVRTLSDPAYRQMVSEMMPSRPNTLFAALWDDPGGLGAFDVTTPAEFDVIDTLTLPELRRANRVRLSGDHAFVPLEQDPGGFAVIDISRTDDLRLVGVVVGISNVTTPYALEVNGDWLYVFGTAENSMAVFELQRGERGH